MGCTSTKEPPRGPVRGRPPGDPPDPTKAIGAASPPAKRDHGGGNGAVAPGPADDASSDSTPLPASPPPKPAASDPPGTGHPPSRSPKHPQPHPSEGSSAGSEGIHVMGEVDPGWSTAWADSHTDPDSLQALLDMPTQPASAELMAAIDDGKVDTLLRMLRDRKVSPNGVDTVGYTPLHKAVLRRDTSHERMVTYLIKFGADTNAWDKQRARPLHVAVRQKNLPAVRALLQAPTMADPLGSGGADFKTTPLHCAAEVGYEEVLDLLLRACAARVDEAVSKTTGASATPLHLAARKGHAACVATLIRRMRRGSVSLDHQDDAGNTPALLAALGGHREVIKALCEAGADATLPNHAGDTVESVLRLRDAQGYQGPNTTAYNPAARGAREGGSKDSNGAPLSTPLQRRKVPASAKATPPGRLGGNAAPNTDGEEDNGGGVIKRRLSKGPRLSSAGGAAKGRPTTGARVGSGELQRTPSTASGGGGGGGAKKVVKKKTKGGKVGGADSKGRPPRDSGHSSSANNVNSPTLAPIHIPAHHDSSSPTTPSAHASSTHERVFTDSDFTHWQRGGGLGKGAFGVVCEGLLRDGTLLAVKTIDFNDEDESEMQATKEEFDLIKELRHKNILQYYGVQILRGQLQIFMEIAPLGSVASLVKRIGAPLSVHVIRNFTRQLLEGLQYLHDNGVIHRDVKGDNLLLGEGNVLKLCDFGSSRRFNMMMTAANCKTLIGTPLWMAPEVINLDGTQGGYNSKADIWSVGIVQIEMLNSLPWKIAATETPWAVMFHIGSSGRRPDGIPDTCHPLLRDFMHGCFERAPKKRPDARALLRHRFLTCDEQELDRVGV